MRRNYKKKSVNFESVPQLAITIIIVLAIVLMSCVVIDSKCSDLIQQIHVHERDIAALENKRVREEAQWNEKKTPEKLEQAMLQHGLAMSYPAADQVVRIDAAGVPLPNQISVARFNRNRSANERVAKTGRGE